MRIFSLVLIVLSFFACQKEKESKPIAEVKDIPQIDLSTLEGEKDPLAIAGSQVGGTITLWAGSYPKSLNMWEEYTSFTSQTMGLLFEPLLDMHSEKDEPLGVLAKSWEVSEDQTEYTFHLNPKAKWSDGKSISAEDVQFYYDIIMNPKNRTPIFRVGLSRFERPVVLDSLTIKIKAKTAHWKNFWEVGGMMAFPKHKWQNKDFNKIKWDFPVVSGPYKMGTLKENRSLTLKRREDWWGRKLAWNAYKFNFTKIRFRFISDRVKALEALKKGDYDFYQIYTSSIWVKQTDFSAIDQGYVVKERVFNRSPLGFQGMAINLRKDKFKDKRVRQALAYLFNRQQMNEKLMYNQYFLLNSFFPSLYPNNTNPKQTPIPFDPNKARQLLNDAGWVVNSEGILEKNGEAFSIRFMSASPDLRHLTVYVEDLKAVGIKASIEKLTYATIRKRIQSHDFDLHWSAWGASRLTDPEASWHSKTAQQKGSNNTPGFENALVDSLIEEMRVETDISKRNKMLMRLDSVLTEEVPYVLMWQNDNARLLYWDKFKTLPYRFSKFGGDESIITYWSFDPEKERKLKQAEKTGKALPVKKGDIKFKD